MTLYDRILGNPWVYDKVRTFVVGGFAAYQSAFDWLELEDVDVLLDVGCGTGATFNFINHSGEYHGFDTDARAIETFRRKHAERNLQLYPRRLTPEDMERILPTKGLLIGVLHHLDDAAVESLFDILARGRTLQKLVTLDTVYVRGQYANNILASLDRGRHVRTERRYRELMDSSSFSVEHAAFLRSGNGLAAYYATCLSAA